MKDAFKTAKIYTVIQLLCFAVFSLYPMFAFVFENRLVQIMRIEFPSLDQTNLMGYLIGLAIMLLFGVLAVLGTMAFDLMILLLLLEYGSLVTLLIHDLDDYHEMWKQKELFSSQRRVQFLGNICLKYQDINKSTLSALTNTSVNLFLLFCLTVTFDISMNCFLRILANQFVYSTFH